MGRKKSTISADRVEKTRLELKSKFGEESVLNYEEASPVETISTGIISLDAALGGGLPEGRMTEISGDNSSGKTTIALSTCVGGQTKYPDKVVVYIDAEHALDLMWAKKLGVNFKKFEHCEPEYGEDAIFMMEAFLATGQCSVIILDSVAALLPQVEADGAIGDSNIGLQARLISQAMRRINRLLNKFPETVLIFINQKRAQIAGGPASFRYEPSKNTGGKALPFYMTTRLPVAVIRRIKDKNDSQIGQEVRVTVFKHKVNSGPGKRITFQISNEHGVDTAHELLRFGLDTGLLIQAGSWFTFTEIDQKVQGEENAKELIREQLSDSWKELALAEFTK